MATKGKGKELPKPIVTRSSSQASVKTPTIDCVKVEHVVSHSDSKIPTFYLFDKGKWTPHSQCSIFQTCKDKFELQDGVDWAYIPVANDYTSAVGTKKITPADYFAKKEQETEVSVHASAGSLQFQPLESHIDVSPPSTPAPTRVVSLPHTPQPVRVAPLSLTTLALPQISAFSAAAIAPSLSAGPIVIVQPRVPPLPPVKKSGPPNPNLPPPNPPGSQPPSGAPPPQGPNPPNPIAGMATTQPPNEFKLGKIEYYDGKHGSAAREFIRRCKLYFMHEAQKFTNERDKCLFVLFNLSGDAFAWGSLYQKELIEQQGTLYNLMAKFADFESSFLAQFSSVNKLATAEFDIKSLKQKGTVAEYAAVFQVLANQTNRNDGAKKAQFRFGLKDQIQRAIVIVPNAPKGYEEYLNWVIGIGDTIDQVAGTVGINANNSGTVGYSSNRIQRFQRNLQGLARGNPNAATGSNAISN